MEVHPQVNEKVIVAGTRSYLEELPADLKTKVLTFLPSFLDVFAVASTSRHMMIVWLDNVGHIYRNVAVKSIPCLSKARCFLAEYGGAKKGTPVSAHDVCRMVRHSIIIEKTIILFEQQIVRRVHASGYDHEKIYGKGFRRHPPKLTKTEQPRFIRNYYKVLEFMRMDQTDWMSRIQAMTLKDLYHLCEMCHLGHSIGNEETIPPHPDPNAEPTSISALHLNGQSLKRKKLEELIWAHICHEHLRIHGRAAPSEWVTPSDDGAWGFVVIWDHWQENLKGIVCGRLSTWKPELWDNTSNEEGDDD